MDYLFSPSAGGFFPLSDEDSYKAAGLWPIDGIQITEAEHDGLFPIPLGKDIGLIDNKPCWVNMPPPSIEELISQAEQKRQFLLKNADEVTADWRTELVLGEIDEESKAKLSLWMGYKREVKAVDISTAPDIIWPFEPEA